MADASTIEQYKGDPALAFGSNALPGGSNAEIVDTSPAIKYWSIYAQNKFNLQKDALDEINKQRLLNAAKLQKAFELNNYKIWDADKDAFNKQFAEFKDILKKPGAAAGWLSGDPMNPYFQDVQNKLDELNQVSQFSAQQQEDFNTLENSYRLHPEVFPDNFQDTLVKYRDGGVDYRTKNPIVVEPTISFNAPDFVNKLKNAIQPTQQLTTERVGGRYVDTTETIYSPEDITGLTKTQYQTDKKFQRGLNDAFAALPQAEQQKFGDAVGYASAMAYDALNGGTKVVAKNPFYPPAYTQPDKPVMNWIVDNAIALSDPNSQVYTAELADASGKPVGKVSHAFDNLMIQTKGKDAQGNAIYSPVKGIYYRDGKIYANTEAKEAGTGKTAMNDLVEITSPYTQIIIPFSNQQYGSSPALAKGIEQLTEYGQQIDQSNFLKIPGAPTPQTQPQAKPINKAPKTLTGKVNPSELVKGESYIVNGKTYIWDGSKLKPQ